MTLGSIFSSRILWSQSSAWQIGCLPPGQWSADQGSVSGNGQTDILFLCQKRIYYTTMLSSQRNQEKSNIVPHLQRYSIHLKPRIESLSASTLPACSRLCLAKPPMIASRKSMTRSYSQSNRLSQARLSSDKLGKDIILGPPQLGKDKVWI